jgi:hypothetical protein
MPDVEHVIEMKILIYVASYTEYNSSSSVTTMHMSGKLYFILEHREFPNMFSVHGNLIFIYNIQICCCQSIDIRLHIVSFVFYQIY